ncbi:c-type cytochrome [Aquimarina sp. 2304DJ70-9]|uniref:c-type cytochrome n=1 Tax=Aquimarina penaris TaxID=3231044 RepID=UPI0034620CF2
MNVIIKLVSVFSLLFLVSCGGKEEEKKEKITIQTKKTTTTETKKTTTSNAIPPSKRVDLVNKGVGPIKTLVLSENIDQNMVKKGQELFKVKCGACHKPHKKFIGPAPTGILERRTPEWIMNMILNPEEMVKEDPLAKELLVEHNGSPMANQSLVEDEARAILEYFRTLKEEN